MNSLSTETEHTCALKQLIFQLIHADHYFGENNNKIDDSNDHNRPPILRMFGRVTDKVSICVHVHGFWPRLFIKVPNDFNLERCNSLKQHLNRNLQCKTISNYIMPLNPIREVYILPSLTSDEDEKGNLIGVLVMASLRLIPAVRGQFTNARNATNPTGMAIYNATVISIFEYENTFLKALNGSGFCWVELPPEKYAFRNDNVTTTCGLEADVNFQDINCHLPLGPLAKIIPFKIMYIDIECFREESGFLVAEEDPIIQISSIVISYGIEEPIIKTVYVTGSCEDITDGNVVRFKSETDLLNAWSDLVREVDCEIICGFHLMSFDIMYILTRAKCLSLTKPKNLGRILNCNSTCVDANSKNGKINFRQKKFCQLHGRIIFDVYLKLSVDCKDNLEGGKGEKFFDNLQLKTVSTVLLNETKHDVQPQDIPILHKGTDLDRAKLASYCLNDNLLVNKIVQRKQLLQKYINMAIKMKCRLFDIFQNPEKLIDIIQSQIPKSEMLSICYNAAADINITSSCADNQSKKNLDHKPIDNIPSNNKPGKSTDSIISPSAVKGVNEAATTLADCKKKPSYIDANKKIDIMVTESKSISRRNQPIGNIANHNSNNYQNNATLKLKAPFKSPVIQKKTVTAPYSKKNQPKDG